MKRIRTLEKRLTGINSNEKYRVAINLKNIAKTKIEKLGLDIALNQSKLPPLVGPISKFNSRGKFVSLKHLEKKPRYICTREWTREEWIGGGKTQTVTTIVDIYRDCYPQDFIMPPAIDLTKIKTKNIYYLVSDELENKASYEKKAIHTINLFLELFGSYEILKDGAPITETVKVNWRFLPPGKKLWSQILSHIQENNKKGESIVKVITARQEFIENLNPEMTYVGAGGFSDYVAYVFKNFTLLESISFGNAIYVFKENWEALSQRSKGELLSEKLAKRIIHTEGWQDKVLSLFK